MAKYNMQEGWSGNDAVQDGVTNPYYRIWMSKGPDSRVSTPMPENWSSSLSIGWSPQFASLMQDMISGVLPGGMGEKLAAAAAAGGYQPQNKTLTANIWTGTSHFDLNIPFVFKVEKDVKQELLIPLQRLLTWALPSTGLAGSMMKAPYAPLINATWGGQDINNSSKVENSGNANPVCVQFGNFFTLPQCVITNISQSYDAMFDSQGKPLSAKIDVSVQSVYAITTEDLAKMYGFSS